MKILRLTQQEYSFFDWLDPFGFLERMALPNYFAFTASVDSEEEGFDRPAGLMICSVESDLFIVEWICVDTELRGSGIACEML